MTRITTLVVALAAAAILAPQALTAMSHGPVTTVHSAKLGTVLATRGHLALYTWNREKDKKVHCTGACAKTWPPLTVPKGTMVEKHVAGAMGTFSTIVRPDGSRQVTWDGRPLYTFHGDTATKILCNGVDGWFVVKA
jgi:predicted lipoprotein with Yx(FWY)xxD motif